MKPLDHTHPVLAHAVFLIRRRLCDVHVEAGPEVSARGGGSLERRVGESERRVQAEHRAQPLVAPAPQRPTNAAFSAIPARATSTPSRSDTS